MIRFYRKFFRRQYGWMMMVLVTTAVWTRFSILALVELFSRLRGRKPSPTMPASAVVEPIQVARSNDRPFDA